MLQVEEFPDNLGIQGWECLNWDDNLGTFLGRGESCGKDYHHCLLYYELFLKLLKFILKWDPCLIVTKDKCIWHRHLTDACFALLSLFLSLKILTIFFCSEYSMFQIKVLTFRLESVF